MKVSIMDKVEVVIKPQLQRTGENAIAYYRVDDSQFLDAVKEELKSNSLNLEIGRIEIRIFKAREPREPRASHVAPNKLARALTAIPGLQDALEKLLQQASDTENTSAED